MRPDTGGAIGGLTTTAPGGGTTATAGRCVTGFPNGALATTGLAGGREAIAGWDGGTDMMGGAWRTGGIIFRGSGRMVAAGGAATATTGGFGLAGCGGVLDIGGRTGIWLRRAAASASCFLA